MRRTFVLAVLATLAAAIVGGPVLGYDPLFAGLWALYASIGIGRWSPSVDWLLEWGSVAGIIGFSLAFVSQIAWPLEILAPAPLSFAVAALMALTMTHIIGLWQRIRARMVR